METKAKRKTTILIEFEEWEARDLANILGRIKNQKKVGKSEFSMREKMVGRRLIVELEKLVGRTVYLRRRKTDV